MDQPFSVGTVATIAVVAVAVVLALVVLFRSVRIIPQANAGIV